jgi:hypothetical protein
MAMKTFKEYAQEKGWLIEGGEDKMVGQAVTQLGLKNPKIVPGATKPKDAARAIQSPQAQRLIKKDPTLAGKLGQAMTGIAAPAAPTGLGV